MDYWFNSRLELPYEIIANIFSRLPAETVFISSRECKPLVAFTRNASFVDTVMGRATPVIVYQYYLGRRHFVQKSNAETTAKSVQVVKLYFTDGAICTSFIWLIQQGSSLYKSMVGFSFIHMESCYTGTCNCDCPT